MIKTEQLLEIRWHGRGGQGGVTSAELIAQAAIGEGKYAQAFPSFGPERRGAPVQAFNRVDANQAIRNRAEITQPDVVVVLDPGLMSILDVSAGLKDGGIMVINTRKTAGEIAAEFGYKGTIATVNATKIAREMLGVPIVNTTMLGALVKATGVVDLASLEKPTQKRFGRLAERNIGAMQQAFNETQIEEQK